MKDVMSDNTWTNRINQAYDYITDLENKYSRIIDTVSQKLDDISLQQEVLLTTFEKHSDYSHTTQLFSPYQNDENKRKNEKISEELKKIKSQIQGFITALEKIKNTKESYTNVLKCLQYTKEVLDKEISNNGKNNQIISNILDAQEFERQRIANDLHDVTIQGMANLVHKSELCIRLIDIDNERAKVEMKVIINQTRNLISSVRQIVYNLKPDVIRDLGLVATLQRFLSEYSKTYHIQTNFNFNNQVESLSESIKISIYRIIQEACNNISKHSHADVCKINLEYIMNKVQLTIEDNGCGLEQKPKCNSTDYSGFGISIMKDRVALLGGSFSILPHVSRGTIIKVSIPYSNKEEKMCNQ